MDISYILNELGEEREKYFNAVAPPIMQSSNFAFDSVADFRKGLQDEAAGFLYTRANNPTVKILSQKLAALDGAEDCLVVNSGAGAIFIAVLANIKSGDHIVSVAQPYAWAQKLFDIILPRFNVSTTYVDGRNTADIEAAIHPNTAIIYLESPNSWSFHLQDLAAVAALARSKRILTICDNSYCTSLYQRPIELGIDLSLQSATKFIGGHSDVVAGVLCGTRQMISKIFNSEYMNTGMGISPFNAWLLIRGLRTLPLRMERTIASTAEVVTFLKTKAAVEKIAYPPGADSGQCDLAHRQMSGGGGLLSFCLQVDRIDQIELFCNSMQRILMAVSWGGHESLIMPAAATISREDFDVNNEAHRRIRLYVGLEEPSYLIEDLQRGFSAIAG